jgi:uncharacterized delta-60 repeat protein
LTVNQDHDFAVARLNSDGSFDQSFGNNGRVTVPFDLTDYKDDNANAVTIQRDGKIVLAGTARTAESDVDMAFARLLPNGTLDPGFGGDGKVTLSFDEGGPSTIENAASVVVRPDGKIVAAGSTRPGGSLNADVAAVRLGPNGTVDGSFGINGKVTVPIDLGGNNAERAFSVAVQPDGKVVMGGPIDIGEFKFAFFAVRVDAAGVLDPTFGTDGVTTVSFDGPENTNFDFATSLLLQKDGKIVLGGFSFLNSPDGSDFAFVRLLGDSGRNHTFGRPSIPMVFGMEADNVVLEVSKAASAKPATPTKLEHLSTRHVGLLTTSHRARSDAFRPAMFFVADDEQFDLSTDFALFIPETEVQ